MANDYIIKIEGSWPSGETEYVIGTEDPQRLPVVSSDDNGDVLTVVGGKWSDAAPGGGSELPEPTSDDWGKVLNVIPNESEAAYSLISPRDLDVGDRSAFIIELDSSNNTFSATWKQINQALEQCLRVIYVTYKMSGGVSGAILHQICAAYKQSNAQGGKYVIYDTWNIDSASPIAECSGSQQYPVLITT